MSNLQRWTLYDYNGDKDVIVHSIKVQWTLMFNGK